jgi:putative effector of murein hydrolase LrgA (UPF0299 family)
MLGLVLLLAFLALRGHVPAAMDLVGSSILQHLGLLFIPALVAGGVTSVLTAVGVGLVVRDDPATRRGRP